MPLPVMLLQMGYSTVISEYISRPTAFRSIEFLRLAMFKFFGTHCAHDHSNIGGKGKMKKSNPL